jgi:hypothetical protein
MRTFTEPRQGRGENKMAARTKPIGNASPAPAAVPGAVHEHKVVGHECPPSFPAHELGLPCGAGGALGARVVARFVDDSP